MISYILLGTISIVVWNVSVIIMDYLEVSFYILNPSIIIIPIIVYLKIYKDFKYHIDIKKLTITYWVNYLILLLNTYLIYYILYEIGLIKMQSIYICSILFFYLFLVFQNIITLYIIRIKKMLIDPFIIMILSILVSIIINLVKFKIFYGTFVPIFIWVDYKELVKEGFFVEFVIIYQLSLFYYINQKLIKNVL